MSVIRKRSDLTAARATKHEMGSLSVLANVSIKDSSEHSFSILHVTLDIRFEFMY